MPLSEAMQAQMLATGGNIGIGAGNFLSQLFFNRSNRRFARQQYQQQVSDTLAQWDRENAYNTPAAQMARFKAAGLNPNLVYGMQNLSAPTSTMGSPNNPNTSAPQFGDLGLSQIPQTYLQTRQIELENRRLDLYEKEVNKGLEKSDAEIRKLTGEANLSSVKCDEIRVAIKVGEKTIEQIDSQIEYNKEQTKNLRISNEKLPEMLDSQIKNLQSITHLNNETAKNIAAVQMAQICEMYSQAGLNKAMAETQTYIQNNYVADSALKSLMGEYYHALKNKTNAEKALVNIQKHIQEKYGEHLTYATIQELLNKPLTSMFSTIVEGIHPNRETAVQKNKSRVPMPE